MRNLQTDTCGPGGETDKTASNIQARSFMARTLGENWEEMLSWRRSKSGHMKNRNSIMPEDYEEFISSALKTRNSKKPWRMLAINWKHQWLPLSLVRQARRVSMGRPVAKPMNSNQNLRVFWKPVNPPDCVWENLYRIIMRTILQEKGTIHCSITVRYRNLFPCSKPWKFPQQSSKGSSGQGMGKIGKDSSVGPDKSQK